jgi:carbamoylphosphate synthase large subunit
MKINIGITCVVSGIGQSVVEALRLCGDSVRIIGFDINPLAYGQLLCNNFYVTGSSQESGYFDSLIDICSRENIKVLIPGLDNELLVLSKASKTFEKRGIKVFVSPESVINLCLDKKKLSEKLMSFFPETVVSFSRREAKKAIKEGQIHFPMIAKPISGSGSKGILIIHDLKELKDISNDYIFQSFIFADENDPDSPLIWKGIKNNEIEQVAEISVQYLISKKGKVLGRMATRNRLKAGVPIEVIPIDVPLI